MFNANTKARNFWSYDKLCPIFNIWKSKGLIFVLTVRVVKGHTIINNDFVTELGSNL